MTPAFNTFSSEGQMAKKKAAKAEEASPTQPGSYTLRRDRQQEFRRTVNYDSGASAVLVFKPGEHLELTAEEVAGIKKDLDSGMVVPTYKDDKGRQKIVRQESLEAIAELERKVEDLTAENAELRAELEELAALTE